MGTLIISIIVFGAFAIVGYLTYKGHKKGNGCSNGCSGCSKSSCAVNQYTKKD